MTEERRQSPHVRILVVEDNKQNRELLVRVLHRWGYEQVECLGDPREFMDRYRATAPELVFVDYRMPYLSGVELIGLMREEPGALERSRVVMLTGDSGASLAQEIVSQGASAVITKPYVLNDLKELLERLVKELHGSQAES
jgi:CheY-like chemotaxis protein